MRMRSECRMLLVVGPLVLASGCGDPGRSQPTVSDRRQVAEHRMTPEQIRQMTGVDRLPQVLDKPAFKASVARHYPAELRAERVSGSALIDVLVDEEGNASSVTAVDRPAEMRAVLVLEEKDGTQRRITPEDHPAFQAAASAALREVRFSPAVRDGQPVPYTLRMTVTFEPPPAREQ